jgi:3-deoxy-7-phosphoheptulonate synthase
MIVVMQEGAREEQVQAVIRKLMDMGFDVHRSTGALQTVLGGVGAKAEFDTREVELMDGVQEAHPVVAPYKLASRPFRPEGSVVSLGKGVDVGGKRVIMMAGPCSVESLEQIETIAALLSKLGVRVIRGRVFPARTSPYSFQGLGRLGLEHLRRVAEKYNMVVVSEVMDHTQVPLMLDYADVLLVGARNMQNYSLLRELGESSKPVLLKRGLAATLEELLVSAECILTGGNYNVILCERGIRTFESATRATLDVSAIPIVHRLSHLPIIADPSQATGRRDKVLPMARAAVAAGADGILVEVHPEPEKALDGGPEALDPQQFERLVAQLHLIAQAVDRTL